MKKSLICLLMIFALFKVQAQQDTNQKDVKIANASEISFTSTEFNYGKIKQNSDGSTIFYFTNTGDKPLVLKNVKTSCGCTVPTWPKDPILPGQKGEIKVVYNTRSLGHFSKSITVISNAISNLVILKIKGDVIE